MTAIYQIGPNSWQFEATLLGGSWYVHGGGDVTAVGVVLRLRDIQFTRELERDQIPTLSPSVDAVHEFFDQHRGDLARLENVPTSAPVAAGMLWDDAGHLRVTEG